MDAHPGPLKAPANRTALGVADIQPVLATKVIVADELNISLDARLVFRVTDPCGIDYETPVAGVLLEDAREDRIVDIGLRDRRTKIVDVMFPISLCGLTVVECRWAARERVGADT